MSKESSKDSKDFQFLLNILKSSDNKIEINYDELLKLDDAPNKAALSKRIERFGKAYGVNLKGARGGLAKSPATKATATKRKNAKEGGDGTDHVDTPKTPAKRSKKGLTKDEGEEAGDEDETPSKKPVVKDEEAEAED